MAPRRGGGGSYSSSSSSRTNPCSENGGFDDTYSRVFVAFLGFFILLGAALLWVYIFHLRKPATRKAAPVYLYGLALLVWTVSQILNLLQLVFSECSIESSDTYNDLGVSYTWMYTIALLLLLATVLFTLCAALFTVVQSRTWRLLKMVHIIAFGIVAILQIASAGMYTWLGKADYYVRIRSSSLILTIARFSAAVDFVTFLVVVLATVSLSIAWSAGRKAGDSPKAVLPWIIVFAVVYGVDWLVLFGLDVNNVVNPSSLTQDTFLAQFIVRQFLEFFAFVAVIAVARQVASSNPTGVGKPLPYAPSTSTGAPEITPYEPQPTFSNHQHPQQVDAQGSVLVRPPPQEYLARPPSPQRYPQQAQPSHHSYYSPSPRPAPEAVPLVNPQPPQQQPYQVHRP